MAASISYQSATGVGGGLASYTLALTVASAAGAERLVGLAAVCQNVSTTDFTNVKIDGQTATQVGSTIKVDDGGTGAGAAVAMWRASGTSNTSINVTFDISGGTATFDGRCALWTLSGAGTVLASGSQTKTKPVSGNLSLNLNTVTAGAAAAIVMLYNSTTHAVSWSGLTERFDGGTLYTNDYYSVADLVVGSTSTPLTVTVTLPTDFVGTQTQAVAGLAVSFNPAAGGTTLTAAGGSYALTGTTARENIVMPLGAAGA